MNKAKAHQYQKRVRIMKVNYYSQLARLYTIKRLTGVFLETRQKINCKE